MCAFESQLRQAFDDFIAKSEPFTVLQVRDRIRELMGRGEPVAYLPVKFELLSKFERERPAGWALSTVSVVDENDGPQNVWLFSPISKLMDVQMMRDEMRADIRQELSQTLVNPVNNPVRSGRVWGWLFR